MRASGSAVNLSVRIGGGASAGNVAAGPEPCGAVAGASCAAAMPSHSSTKVTIRPMLRYIRGHLLVLRTRDMVTTKLQTRAISFARTILSFALVAGFSDMTYAQEPPVTVTVANAPKPISPDLFSIFFEDINYSADGGLYAELVQKRSFEYTATEQLTWTPLTAWELVKRGGGDGTVGIGEAISIHPNNPHYAFLEVKAVGEGVGLMNSGFDGIPVEAGQTYDVSLMASQTYMNQRWGRGSEIEGKPMPLTVRLESKDGELLGETSLKAEGRQWKRLTGAITPTKTDPAARLVVLAMARGGVALDEISLF